MAKVETNDCIYEIFNGMNIVFKHPTGFMVVIDENINKINTLLV